MGQFADAFILAAGLVWTAKEEALVVGAAEVEPEQLLVAVALSPGPAGELLRSHGVRLATARLAAINGARAAGRPTRHSTPASGPVPDSDQSDVTFSERSQRVIQDTRADGLEPGVLRALLEPADPALASMWAELGLDPHQLRAEAEQLQPRTETKRPEPDLLVESVFVPVPPERVWPLVSAPESFPAWQSQLERVAPVGPTTWDVWRSAQTPSRSSTQLFLQSHRYRYRRLPSESDRARWQVTFPSRPTREPERLEVEVAAATGGSIVTFRHGLPPRRRWRRRLPSPGHSGRRLMAKLALVQLGGELSRFLR